MSATPTLDPARAARADAKQLAKRGRYAQAAAALLAADLNADARHMRRRGSRALLRDARSALAAGRFKTAKRFAAESRKLRKTTAARTVLNTANTEIARAEAVARERVRLARIARDQRTCSSTEKRTVRDGPDYTGPVQVVADDPHDLDRDGDGSACESS